MTRESLGPAIVLVEPQLGENIGAAARAMLNCGLTDLRLVRPRDGWPSEKAAAMATGASRRVVDRARLCATTHEAVADLHQVYATTARDRDMLKATVTPAVAVAELRAAASRGERGGFLFGPERTGLENDDVSLAGKILHIPLNPEFSSLNLAQAVLLVAYAWWRSEASAGETPAIDSAHGLATSEQMVNFFEHLEQELDESGFLHVTEKRAVMVRNLRNLFHRAALREHEVRTLHGIVSALSGRRKDGGAFRGGVFGSRPGDEAE